MTLGAMIHRTARRYGYGSLGQRDAQGRPYSVPAPTKGWNTRDGYANMKPEYAITLINCFPDHGAVSTRKGYIEHATGVGSGEVPTLFTQISGSVKRLWAAGGGSIYNVTASGGASEIKTGLTGNTWHDAAFGGRVILVSGDDPPQRIEENGTFAGAHGWAAATGQPALNVNSLHRVLPFKNRLMFLEKDTANMWYGALGAIQGDLKRSDLSRVHPRGGNAVAFGTLTVDGGIGIDDLLVVFMESGAALVYQGTDPESETAWALVGIFDMGRPVGSRPLTRYGGDLVAITADGYIPVAQMLAGNVRRSEPFSDAIQSAVADVVRNYGSTSGWDCIFHPRANWLMFNIPASGGEQHVMNTQTQAWCRFTGMDARSWTEFGDKIMFGGVDGKVYEANTSQADGDSPIEVDVQGAFNYLGGARNKRFTMMRGLVEADGSTRFQMGATTDFGAVADLTVPTNVVAPGARWNEAAWNEAAWSEASAVVRNWQAVNRDGRAVSIRLRASIKGAGLRYFATDVIAEASSGIL